VNVWAVVVNWNGGAENLECLGSLAAAGLPAGRVVFVDNGSTDGSLELVREQHPDVRVVANRENRGYGHGSNQGIELALANGAEGVFLVNNDLVLGPRMLDVLLEELATRPEAGIVGPRVVYKDRPATIWAAGGALTYRQNLSTLLGHGAPDGAGWRVTRRVDYVPGCAMLVRRAVFEDVGLLDGAYFAYHEDVELCLQANEAGWQTWVVGSASALHRAGGATGGGYNARRKWMMGVNTIWFLRKHGTPTRWARFFLFDVLPLPALWLVALFRGRGRAVLAKACGMWAGARGRRVTAEALQPGAGPFW